MDNNGNGKMDQSSYYQDGFEVYSEVDLNDDVSPDEARWMNTAGTRVAVIAVTTYVIGVAGFNHIIAGSTKVLYLVASRQLAWSAYAGQFLVPVLLGNIIGGVALVAFLGHAQVASDKQHSS